MEFFTPASATPSMSVSSAPCDSQRSQYPIVTGTSVLALKYKDGVMMIADTLGTFSWVKWVLAQFLLLPNKLP